MLNIEDNYDMRKLVNFGFKNIDYENIIIGADRIIHYNQFTTHNELNDVIYDLIKANLVEKVEE